MNNNIIKMLTKKHQTRKILRVYKDTEVIIARAHYIGDLIVCSGNYSYVTNLSPVKCLLSTCPGLTCGGGDIDDSGFDHLYIECDKDLVKT